MKKLALLTLLLGFSIFLFGQDKTKTVTMSSAATYVANVTTAADSLCDVTHDTLDYVYKLNKEYPVQYYIFCDVDSVATSPDVTFTLSGKMFDSQDWTTITTVSYTGSADTTFTFSSVASQVFTAALSGTGTSKLSAGITLNMDTTKFYPYNKGDSLNFALYNGSGTIVDTLANAETLTGTLTSSTIASYYRQFRVRAVTTAGKALFSRLELKLWRREF